MSAPHPPESAEAGSRYLVYIEIHDNAGGDTIVAQSFNCTHLSSAERALDEALRDVRVSAQQAEHR